MTRAIGRYYAITDDLILGSEPIIRGTRPPVRATVELQRTGTRPEGITRGLPHLTPAQVFAALSCYTESALNVLIAAAFGSLRRKSDRANGTYHDRFDITAITSAGQLGRSDRE